MPAGAARTLASRSIVDNFDEYLPSPRTHRQGNTPKETRYINRSINGNDECAPFAVVSPANLDHGEKRTKSETEHTKQRPDEAACPTVLRSIFATGVWGTVGKRGNIPYDRAGFVSAAKQPTSHTQSTRAYTRALLGTREPRMCTEAQSSALGENTSQKALSTVNAFARTVSTV